MDRDQLSSEKQADLDLQFSKRIFIQVKHGYRTEDTINLHINCVLIMMRF